MSISRPAPLRKRALLTTAAVALTAATTGPAAGGATAAGSSQASPALSQTYAAKKRTRKSQGGQQPRGLLVRWTGVPRSGEHAGQTITDTYGVGGVLAGVAHRTSAGDALSIWAPIIDDGSSPLTDTPPVETETRPLKGGGACFTNPAYAATAKDFATWAAKLRASFEAIDRWHTDPEARRTLPSGPVINGRQTVAGTVTSWLTLDRTGATVALDAATGAVLRITPIGLPDFAVDLTDWSVRPATTKQLVGLVADPEWRQDLFARELCR